MSTHPLHHLRLRNWRNIEAAEVELDSHQTIFVGENGQGKSNLIEAVFALATATSFRVHRDEELIRWGEPAAHLRGSVAFQGETSKMELGLDRDQKKKIVKIDGVPLPRLADIYGHLRVTLLAPKDLAIVSGSPENRRRYLDMLISQLEPEHVRTLQGYRRALRHRNQILRRLSNSRGPLQDAHLEAWDQQCATLGADIMCRRAEAVGRLIPWVSEHHDRLAGDGETLTVSYQPSVLAEPGAEEEAILEMFAGKRTRDIETGATSTGPHRDDLRLRLHGREIATHASQGQRRTVALALRLAEARVVAIQGGAPTLLLIDDVVYEMDVDRKARFWSSIPEDAQRIVTATHTKYLGQETEEGRIYHVERGQVRSH